MELYQKRSLSRALYDQKFSKIKLPHDPVTVENFPSAQKRMDPSLIHPFSSFIIFRKDLTFLKIHLRWKNIGHVLAGGNGDVEDIN